LITLVLLLFSSGYDYGMMYQFEPCEDNGGGRGAYEYVTLREEVYHNGSVKPRIQFLKRTIL